MTRFGAPRWLVGEAAQKYLGSKIIAYGDANVGARLVGNMTLNLTAELRRKVADFVQRI